MSLLDATREHVAMFAAELRSGDRLTTRRGVQRRTVRCRALLPDRWVRVTFANGSVEYFRNEQLVVVERRLDGAL